MKKIIIFIIELFILQNCPYCKKVEDYINKHNIAIRKLDISEKENRQRLINLGGKTQVPFLVHGNTKMYESDAIITYLNSLL